ncbi:MULTISPECIES: S8 family serine peptidase [Streptomyces]|uniref:S8 family serine peptidase n=1 Tax=Streptomyces TaxID=1883 RepID=UPI00345B57E0
MTEAGADSTEKAAETQKKIRDKAEGAREEREHPHAARSQREGWQDTFREKASECGTSPSFECEIRRYLVAPCPPGLLAPGLSPVQAETLFAMLDNDPDVRLSHVQDRHVDATANTAELSVTCPPVAIVEMSEKRARLLASNPRMLVEEDQPLTYAHTPPETVTASMADPMLASCLDAPTCLRVQVTGQGGVALPEARVWVTGSVTTTGAVTDATGWATLRLPGDSPVTIKAIYARPAGGHWPALIDRPYLPHTTGTAETVIECTPLEKTIPGFPEQPFTGWGHRAMRLDQLPSTYRGQGVRIALLDAGVNADHPDLKEAVCHGHDLTHPLAHPMWQSDATGLGTWCAGIIAAANNRTGITGIAPEAQVHALRVYPHGRLSDLLRAIDYCLTEGIDIAQINVNCTAPSQLLAWKLLDAHIAGITVIAPAGTTGDALSFPARLPTVLAVGALPQSPKPASDHTPAYAPSFHHVAPGVDLKAPASAIVTTSAASLTGPADAYIPADGLSLAAAHITGLAALLLAHHHQLSTFPHRSAARVTHLHSLLRNAGQPPSGAHQPHYHPTPPDAPTALGLTPANDWPYSSHRLLTHHGTTARL